MQLVTNEMTKCQCATRKHWGKMALQILINFFISVLNKMIIKAFCLSSQNHSFWVRISVENINWSPQSLWCLFINLNSINKFSSYEILMLYSASIETVHNTSTLLPAETAVHDKWLPAWLPTIHVILLPAKTLGRKHNHKDSLGRKPFFYRQKSWKEARDLGQSQWKPNMLTVLDGRKSWQTNLHPLFYLSLWSGYYFLKRRSTECSDYFSPSSLILFFLNRAVFSWNYTKYNWISLHVSQTLISHSTLLFQRLELGHIFLFFFTMQSMLLLTTGISKYIFWDPKIYSEISVV